MTSEPLPSSFDPTFDPGGGAPDPARLPAGTVRDPIVVSGGGLADVIAAAWYQLGYRPTDSLVLVGLDPGSRPETGRLGRVARMDFPPWAGVEHRRLAVAGTLEPLRVTGDVRSVLAIVFGEGVFGAAAFTAAGFGPPVATADLITDELSRAGVRTMDVLGVSAGGWLSLRCSDPACCPAEGRPLAEVEQSPAAAAHVLLGSELVADEASLLRDVRPVDRPEFRTRGTSESGAVQRRLTPASRRLQWLVWERAFAAGEIADGRAAALAPYLADPFLRDAVVIGALGGDRDAVLASLQYAGGPLADPYPLDLMQVTRIPPDEPEQAARVERARAVLATAARFAGPGERGDALAVLALLAWYRNDAARARLLVAAAHADRPGQTLARLVDDLLLALAPPPWIRSDKGAMGGLSGARPGSRRSRRRDTRRKYS